MLMFIVNGLVITGFFVGGYVLYLYLKSSGETLKSAWWKWVLPMGWLFGFCVTFGFIGATYGEGSPEATLRGGLSFLALMLISGGLIFRFCLMKIGKAKKEE